MPTKTYIRLFVYLVISLYSISANASPIENCSAILSAIKTNKKNPKRNYLATPSAWNKYIDRTQDINNPRNTVVLATEFTNDAPGLAVDIGAGSGRDTFYLLNEGWHVLAIDFSPKAITLLKQKAQTNEFSTLTAEQQDFLHMQLPEQIDLANAYLSLPFVDPKQFQMVWDNIMSHIKLDGLFAGSLLGDQDDFAEQAHLTVLSEAQIKCLMAPYKVLYLKRIAIDEQSEVNNTSKHWDIWEFIIQKTSPDAELEITDELDSSFNQTTE